MLRTSPRLPLRSRVSAALKAFRFSGSGGGGYGGGSGWPGWWGWWGLNGGSRYDFAKEVGLVHLNGVVLAAVNWFALTWSEAPLVVYRPRKNDKPEMLKEHPALDLLAKPNPYYDDTILWGSSMLSLLTAGNGYWAKQRSSMGVLTQLLYIPDFQMEPYWPKDGSDYITGYRYRVDGVTIDLPRSEVVQLRWPVSDPGNQRKGLSPLAAELKHIAIDNEVSNYTASILRNMGIPGVIIAPKDDTTEITPENAERIKSLYVERFSGDNRGAPFVPSLPIDVHSPGYSPEQMALDKIVDQPVPRICAALRIDPMVLGYSSPSKTYSNMKEAIEAAYERTLMPFHREICSQMTEQIMPDLLNTKPGDYFGHDYSEVRALQEDMDAVYKRLSEAVKAGWLAPNDAREQAGLKPIDGGDELRPAPGMGGGFGNEGQQAVPRAASLSPTQKAIAAVWRKRADARRQTPDVRTALPSSNGHGR